MNMKAGKLISMFVAMLTTFTMSAGDFRQPYPVG